MESTGSHHPRLTNPAPCQPGLHPSPSQLATDSLLVQYAQWPPLPDNRRPDHPAGHPLLPQAHHLKHLRLGRVPHFENGLVYAAGQQLPPLRAPTRSEPASCQSTDGIGQPLHWTGEAQPSSPQSTDWQRHSCPQCPQRRTPCRMSRPACTPGHLMPEHPAAPQPRLPPWRCLPKRWLKTGGMWEATDGETLCGYYPRQGGSPHRCPDSWRSQPPSHPGLLRPCWTPAG
mmetsp:Transcript_31611/g.89781  ORF Transcript_31611/g.89781 Transcript_31611/m.89781 type:complete len:229 (-) Transcript_31611:2425-3111(-)